MADAQKTLKAAPQDRLQATLTASGLAASLVPMIERGVADDVAIVPSTSRRHGHVDDEVEDEATTAVSAEPAGETERGSAEAHPRKG